MNRNQLFAISLGATIVLLMLVFPPFHVELRDYTLNKGYAFILDPPKQGRIRASVDVGMLIAQWVGTLILTGLALVMLASKTSQRPHRDPKFSVEENQETGKAPSTGTEERGARANEIQSSNTEALIEKQKDQGKAFLGGIYHPWRRFFARTVDLIIPGALVLLSVVLFFTYEYPQNAENIFGVLENPVLAGIILYLCWIPVEAALIASTGTTPAKWIFGISVLSREENKLSYASALRRTLLVWAAGDGFSIPILTIFTRLFAYFRLVKTGTTVWDKSSGSVVQHEQWGPIRSISATMTVLLAIFVLGVLVSIGENQA